MRDVLRRQAVVLEEPFLVAGRPEGVLDADAHSGTGADSASTSATAPPRPPMIECSSAVTMAPQRFAAAMIGVGVDAA